MQSSYPKFKKGELAQFEKTLKASELKHITDYLVYRKGRGLNTASNFEGIKRFLLQVRFLLKKPLTHFTLEDLRNVMAVINSSTMTESYKNVIRAHLKNFLKYSFKDWSERFSGLDDIRGTKSTLNQERINYQTIFKKEDIEALVKAETKNYWRALLLTQYEAGLRTKEVRFLKWSDIKLNIEDGLTEISIFATKTKKARTIYVKEATHYLTLLKKEQENLEDKGTFVFHAKTNKDKPVEKYSVNLWFKKLTKRTLGREGWNYLLRHSRASELYMLAKENKISKDTAIAFMGHSEDMSEVYTHANPSDVKKMLRDQVYNIEVLAPEQLNKYQKKVADLEKVNDLSLQVFEAMINKDTKKMVELYTQLREMNKNK